VIDASAAEIRSVRRVSIAVPRRSLGPDGSAPSRPPLRQKESPARSMTDGAGACAGRDRAAQVSVLEAVNQQLCRGARSTGQGSRLGSEATGPERRCFPSFSPHPSFRGDLTCFVWRPFPVKWPLRPLRSDRPTLVGSCFRSRPDCPSPEASQRNAAVAGLVCQHAAHTAAQLRRRRRYT
jgi:hypothetical protein